MNGSDSRAYKIFEIISFVLLGLSFVILILQCPIAVLYSKEIIPDGYVFKYIGIQMTKGQMPYLDIFDHKGPLTYLINYWAALINRDYGIMILEILINGISAAFLFLIPVKCGCNKAVSAVIAFASMAYYCSIFEAGNFVEEFALPFTLFSLWVFTDFFLNNKVDTFRLVLCGSSLGAVMLLRPNMAVLWVVFCIAVLIKCIKEKRAKELIPFILKFIAGMAAVILPVMLWLYIKGAWGSFFEQYIVFNLTYSDTDPILRSIAMMDMIKRPVIFIPVIIIGILIFLHFKKKAAIPGFMFAYIFYIIIQSVLFTMAGTSYDHYYITAVPFLAYPLAEIIKAFKEHKKIYYVLVGCIALGGILLNITPLSNFIDYAVLGIRTPADVAEMIDIIKTESREEDKITVLGNWGYIYLASDRESATRYTYAKPIIYLDRTIYDDYFNELDKEVPRIIVLEFNNDEIKEFLNKHSYYIIYKSKYFFAVKTDENVIGGNINEH